MINRSWVLWLLPLAFLAVLLVMRHSSLPFWQSFNLDPDYYYLLNGLRLVEGLPPTDVSHPGVPVQTMVALAIRLCHPTLPAAQVVDRVLADPEYYLMVATSVIYGLVTLALWGMGRSIFLATGMLAPALLAQSAPFLSRLIPKFALHPKPEPAIIIAVSLLIAVLMPLVVSTEKSPSRRWAALAGVVVAFGVACKIHFVILGIIPFLLLDRRGWLAYLGAGTLALAVFIAPAIPSWPIWVDWIGRLVMGSGAYGDGAQTVIDPQRYPRTILKLFSSKLILSAVLLLSLAQLAAYFRLRRRGLMAQDRHARLLLGIIIAQIVTVLAVAKQPAPHYMIPPLLLSAPAMACLWSLSRPVLGSGIHGRVWTGIGLILAVTAIPQMWAQNAELAGWTAEQTAIDLKTRYPGCARVYFDAASAPSYALQRGDMNAAARYSSKLAPLFPADEYTWFTNDHTWWAHGVMRWNQRMGLSSVIGQYPCVVFRGNQDFTVPAQAQREIPGFRFDGICPMGEETIMTWGVGCDGTPVKK